VFAICLQVWDNYLHAAMQVKDWQRAMQAVERVVDIRLASRGRDVDSTASGALVDLPVLLNLNAAMIALAAQSDSEWLLHRWDSVLSRLTSRVTTDASLWTLQAEWMRARHRAAAETESREKAFRAALLPIPASHPSVRSRVSAFQLTDTTAAAAASRRLLLWTESEQLLDAAVAALQAMLRCYADSSDDSQLHAGLLAIGSLVSAVQRKASSPVRQRWEAEHAADVAGWRERLDRMRKERQRPPEAAAAAAFKPGTEARTASSSWSSLWR
jgi:hypothetical protein